MTPARRVSPFMPMRPNRTSRSRQVIGCGCDGRRPTAEEIARTQLVFLARVSERTASRLRHIVDSAGVLLNVEDDIARSDFHSPSIVRRGDLTLAISTGSKSPGLAAAIRRQIEASFGSELGVRLENIAVPPAQGGRRRRARPEPYG